jgi:serine/threonine protein phosphatase PrpC
MRIYLLLFILVNLIEFIVAFTVISERTFYKSLAGSDPDVPNKVNQDAAFSLSLDKYICCGVLDGHGKKGHELNAFLCPYIENTLREKLQSDPNPSTLSNILEHTFEEAQLAAQLADNVPAARSGTTCVITVLDKTTGIVYTANVGDSRAIIGTKLSSMDDMWHVQPLSTETTTSCPEERARIEKGEGRIDAGGNVWYGPVGIAMTRSLGNSVMKRANIISTPIITTYRIAKDVENDISSCEGECLIVTGTDGIFDVLSNEAVIHLLATSCDSEEDVCDNLILEARNSWQQGLPMDVRIDDTSCAVISISFTC